MVLFFFENFSIDLVWFKKRKKRKKKTSKNNKKQPTLVCTLDL